MILSWLNTKEVDEFAKILVAEMATRYPPGMENDKGQEAVRKLTNTLDALYTRAAKFRRDKNLGMFKKAKLGNVFKWGLLEKGYTSDFVDNVTKGLIIHLAKK